MKSGSGPKAAPEGPAAKPDARSHLSLVDGQPLQLGLFIPNHPLHPAEADLRLVTNTIRRERHHWWLYTWDGRQQRALLERLGWWAA